MTKVAGEISVRTGVIFSILVTIILAMGSFMYGQALQTAEVKQDLSTEISAVKRDVAVIQTDVSWIKENMANVLTSIQR